MDAALRCGVKPFSTLTALLCKAVRAYLDKDEVLYSYSTDARDALGAPNASTTAWHPSSASCR